MKTHNIVFRKCKIYGDIIVVFLGDKYNENYKLTCYSRTGQHGGCCINWLYHDTKPAKWDEYKDLFFELLKIYDDCNLVVKKRLPRYSTIMDLFLE